MKTLLIGLSTVLLVGCANNNGNGDPNFCPAEPTGLSTVGVGQNISTVDVGETSPGLNLVGDEVIATYGVQNFNSTYSLYCWNVVIKTKHATGEIVEVVRR